MRSRAHVLGRRECLGHAATSLQGTPVTTGTGASVHPLIMRGEAGGCVLLPWAVESQAGLSPPRWAFQPRRWRAGRACRGPGGGCSRQHPLPGERPPSAPRPQERALAPQPQPAALPVVGDGRRPLSGVQVPCLLYLFSFCTSCRRRVYRCRCPASLQENTPGGCLTHGQLACLTRNPYLLQEVFTRSSRLPVPL